MDYAQQQRNPSKHAVGIGVVIAMHVFVAWALMTGLAKKVVDVIKAPIETKLIEEIKPPPPPPPENLPPPPKFAPPPPSFVPPPEVQINNPPPAPAITVTREAPPPEPVRIAPPPKPEAPPAPPAPAAPARTSPEINWALCKPEYPSAALRAETTGTTLMEFTMDTSGKITSATVIKPSGFSREHRLLDRTLVDTVMSGCSGKPGTIDGKPQPLTTRVEYVWKLVN